ncbi:hypothetical protein CEXT_397611 [Caerostris extrusa]|uniref:Uncharacterized protein n=1 Tax=Caerostris extrusa TaxID=172846 RepID=A0AAV4WSH4_CAEEX|nr:hypothetical protein CEXT_397611 [Caerostris extrusa]
MPFDKLQVTRGPPQSFKVHDVYSNRVSFGNTMTRSQTAFHRLDNTKSQTWSFLKWNLSPTIQHASRIGRNDRENGAIPRTTITRSTANRLSVDSKLTKIIDNYITLSETDPHIQRVEEIPGTTKSKRQRTFRNSDR